MSIFELDSKKQWLREVRRIESPNCDERPADTDISLLVVHGISLPPGDFGGQYIDQFFTNTLDPDEHPYFREIRNMQVSAHLLIDRAGGITQYVPFNKRAWHAGESEFMGCQKCNDFSIGIELEGTDDEPYEKIQYQRLAALSRMIMDSWPLVTPERISGHCHIAPGRKTDPGPFFDWDSFHDLLHN